ncbi:unnamed protein product [Rhizoctonia solani]|uniref:non-reducing end alpha-L-arabinofuranosidase n=1 Tax=Rhizoctonia solani TaxID=456999 RepID=A0A8H3CCW2_9AGAM|nr:unnamed protein product [Rhizoctonia solani]
MSATISIDPAHAIAQVDDRLYSGFIEHLGRCIYGGIVPDPTTPKDLITPTGFRKDVLHLLRDELKVPIVRWPGGNFVSAYQWQDGIGPAEQRPRRPELAWGSEESNLFGMDEYMTWCKEAKVEPYICLNMGTGTLTDALAWLEYANGTRNTYWANLRRKHTGRDEPYGAKLWGLGNEMYGKWQIGQLPAKEYAQKAHQWAHALKSMDPSIVLISCGEIGVSSWDYEVLQKLVPWVDYHSIHLYTSPGPDAEFKDASVKARYERNVFGPAAAEKAIDICTGLIDLARIEQNVSKPIKIAFDEWNSWDFTKGTPENGLEQIYDLSDALAIASWMNVFIRKADKVAIACIAQSVNVISPIITTPNSHILQTIYHPYYLFAKYMRSGTAISLALTGQATPQFDGQTQPAWSQFAAGPQPYLDASAVYVEGGEGGGVGSVRVAVVNRHLELALGASLRFPETLVGAGRVQVRAKYDKFEVWAADVTAANTAQTPEAVKAVQTSEEWDSSKPIVFKEHSFTLLIFTFEKA